MNKNKRFKITLLLAAAIMASFIFTRPYLKKPFSPHSAGAEGFRSGYGKYPCELDEAELKTIKHFNLGVTECKHNYILGIPVNF